MGIENENTIVPNKNEGGNDMEEYFFDFLDLDQGELERLQGDKEAYRAHKSEIIHNVWGRKIAQEDKEALKIHEAKLDAVFENNPLFKGDEHFYEAMQSKIMRRHYALFETTGEVEHKHSLTQHIEDTRDWLSQHGRINKWKKVFEEPVFTGQRLKLRDMPKFSGDVEDFESFKAALYTMKRENIGKAKAWLEAIRDFPEDIIPHVREEDREMVFEHRETEIQLFEKLLERKSFYFQVMVESQEFEEAEAWLKKAKESERYNNRTIDHRERELFKAYCALRMWQEAKVVIENSVLPESKNRRKQRLTELSRMKYNAI